MSGRTFYLALATLAAPAIALADDPLEGWQVTGSNTVRLETYRVRGDPGSGPYRFDGGQYFDELNLNFVRALSAYDTIRGQLYGVANDSAYRAPDRGLVPERVNVTREKGDGAIPYRAEAGDLFAYFSYRTLQRSLKGAQVELQPASGGTGLRQSIVLVSGADQPSWRHVQARDNWTTGASWLVEVDPQSRFTANVLHNTRQADAARGLPDRRQTVASVTADYGAQWGPQRLRFEGELAGLRGDHDGFAGANGAIDPATGHDRHGQGAFAQLSGSATGEPFDYRLRYERYDRDFRPSETVIIPDHRSEEAFAGWRFENGTSLRARAQRFVDAMQSGNDLRTTTYGASLAGALPAGVSGNLDLFHQDLTKRDATVDRGVRNANASLTRPLPGQWVGSLGLFWQQVDDRVPGAADVRTSQAQVSATHALSFAGWYGSFSPGITLRRVDGGPAAAVREVSPALALMLSSGAHSLGASYGYQRLRPDASSVASVDVNLFRLDYRYTRGRDTLGVEASAYDRRVTVGTYNETYRLSVFWTHTFDKPARAAPVVATAAGTPASLPRDIGLLLAIQPGADFGSMAVRLEEAGYRGGLARGDALVFEARLLSEVEQRQRLAITRDGGRVTRTALVVGIDDPNDTTAVAQAYERVRKALLDRFGPPVLTFEEGAIGPTFVVDLNAGRVVRVMEWQAPGGRLRLGIPRRLDGRAHIEIQHAASFGPPRDGAWGIEAVR